MVKFFEVTLVVEANNRIKAEEIARPSPHDSTWIKKTTEMTDDEVFKFFGKTKEDMEKDESE